MTPALTVVSQRAVNVASVAVWLIVRLVEGTSSVELIPSVSGSVKNQWGLSQAPS